MRDGCKAQASVYALIAFGAISILCTPKLLHLLRRANTEYLGRNRKYGKAALLLGLPHALLVLLRAGVIADASFRSVYEVGKLL